VSSHSQLQIFKDKKIWPSKKEESWKYFDFSRFESIVTKSDHSTYDYKIDFSPHISSEIIFKQTGIVISENLKDRIKFTLASKLSLLNKKSNLDFRLTSLNLSDKNCIVSIENQNDLNLTLTYHADLNRNESLNLAVMFDIKNSSVNLLEQDQVSSAAYFSNHLQFKLENSSLEHISLFAHPSRSLESSAGQAKIFNSEISVGEDSSYKNTALILNNKFIRVQQSVSLESPGANGCLNAFNISEDQNFSELRTEVLHLQPKTQSRQLFKTIAADTSKSIFNGRIYVNSLAQKTDAGQLCQGILLHPKAEINAKPELEIYADDVKAAHGAAIGQMGQDQVFYLISRGIKPEVAYKMLSKAFAGEVLASITNLEFRKICQTTMDQSSEAIFEKLAEDITSSGQKL
jgi:Fe-S cluster assembly protein SufD